MKFKVGDKVRIRTDLKINKKYGNQYFVNNMNQHKGKIAIIEQVLNNYYSINLDHYHWTDEMLEQLNVDLTISQLQSEIDKLSNKVREEYSHVISNRDKVNYLKEQLKQLKEENKKEQNKLILDDVEKEYLLNIIKPFRDKVEYISKNRFSVGEFISITIANDSQIQLPNFEKNTMYKGMEAYKKYALKELGLDE